MARGWLQRLIFRRFVFGPHNSQLSTVKHLRSACVCCQLFTVSPIKQLHCSGLCLALFAAIIEVSLFAV